MGDAPSFVAKHGGATLRVDAGGGDETLGMTAKGVRGPTTTVESTWWELGLREVAGVDEVGRGSPFGPCCVGVVVVTPECSRPPRGLDDSKMLSASARERMAPEIRAWAHDSAVGEASAREIDLFGLTAALRLAGWRALAALRHVPGAVILDGSHDWLSIPEEGMLAPPYPLKVPLDVRAVVKGDRSCASVAAAASPPVLAVPRACSWRRLCHKHLSAVVVPPIRRRRPRALDSIVGDADDADDDAKLSYVSKTIPCDDCLINRCARARNIPYMQ